MNNNLNSTLNTIEYAFYEMHAQAEWGGKEDYKGETEELKNMFLNSFAQLKEELA
tara:strand:+ start:139 stop:303 length:165 start_codon:yes stop_codon:yes gene_type:complete